MGAFFFFSGTWEVTHGPDCCGVIAGVLATVFPFSRSMGGSGRVESTTGTEVSSGSNSTIDSVAGVAARGGEATFLSGESGSAAGSGRGELMEECVWVIGIALLHKGRKRLNRIRLTQMNANQAK